MFGAVVLGIFGGIAGAIFVMINFRVNDLRKYCLTSGRAKVIETVFQAFVTSSVFFWSAFILYYRERDTSCLPLPEV